MAAAVLLPAFPAAVAAVAYGAYKKKQKIDREKVTTSAGGFVLPYKPSEVKGMNFGRWDPDLGQFVPSPQFNGICAPRQSMNQEDVRTFRKEIVGGNTPQGAHEVLQELNAPKGGAVVRTSRMSGKVTVDEQARSGYAQSVMGSIAGPTGKEYKVGPYQNGSYGSSVIPTGFGAGHTLAREASVIPGYAGTPVAHAAYAGSYVPSVAPAYGYPAPSVVPGSYVAPPVAPTYVPPAASVCAPSYSGTYCNGGYVF